MRGGSRGFTLLELLISMTILSLITLLVFGAFRVGIRAWERGERDIDAHQRERIVLDLITRQIASIPVDTVQGLEAFAMKGDQKSLAFVSDIHLVPANTFGMVYVIYRVEEGEDDGEILSLSERNVVLMVEDPDMDSDELFTELIGSTEIAFAYLKRSEGEEAPEWQETWDPESETGFPLAVRVTLKRGEDKPSVTAVARIAAHGR